MVLGTAIETPPTFLFQLEEKLDRERGVGDVYVHCAIMSIGNVLQDGKTQPVLPAGGFGRLSVLRRQRLCVGRDRVPAGEQEGTVFYVCGQSNLLVCLRGQGDGVVGVVQHIGKKAAKGHLRQRDFIRKGAVKPERNAGLGEQGSLHGQNGVDHPVPAVNGLLVQCGGDAVQDSAGSVVLVLGHQGVGRLQLVPDVMADAGGVLQVAQVLLVIDLLLFQEVFKPPCPFFCGCLFRELTHGAEEKIVGQDAQQGGDKQEKAVKSGMRSLELGVNQYSSKEQDHGLGKRKEKGGAKNPSGGLFYDPVPDLRAQKAQGTDQDKIGKTNQE